MGKMLMMVLLLVSQVKGYTQTVEPDPGLQPGRQTFVQVLCHDGIYWSRTQYLEEQFADGYRALDVRFGWQTNGEQYWQQVHHYPRYGFGIHYADLVRDPEDSIVGDPLSAFLFYSAPWARFGRFSFNTDMALGISYASLIHDPVANPYNDVIASHINLFFDFSFNLGFRLSERMDLKAGYGVTHYSNGRIHQPQKGVNNWGWNLGLSYLFNTSKAEKSFQRSAFIESPPPEFKAWEELQLMYGVGAVDRHRLGDADGIHYFTSSFTADYAYRFGFRSSLTLGADFLYDGSLAHEFGDIPPEDVTTWQKTYLGGHLGYQFHVDRVTILINLGTYFLQHSYARGYLFSRWGGRLRLTDHLHAHLCIKTKNGVRSDWIEWGMVYSLKVR